MSIIEDAGAWLLGLVAIIAGDFYTMYQWISAHPWFIALACGVLCLVLVAAGKLATANDIIENQTGKDEDE